MQNKHLLKALILMAGVLLCACGQQKVYSRFQHVSETGWEKADTISFSIPPVAEGGLFLEEMGLRINTTFPFQSLTLQVSQTIFPEGRQEKYTVFCPLVDKEGDRTGAGISLFQYTFPIHDITLNHGDSVQINVLHCMKREIMMGITEVGITLSRR